VRILVLGAGVIGSVYAGRLLQAGHQVALVARGRRLTDVRAHGLVLEDAESGEHRELPIEVLDVPAADVRYDLVVVAVRCEQLTRCRSWLRSPMCRTCCFSATPPVTAVG
jgi:2-dehydropantoate 2-reductase